MTLIGDYKLDLLILGNRFILEMLLWRNREIGKGALQIQDMRETRTELHENAAS
jgi:hypothetical protein